MTLGVMIEVSVDTSTLLDGQAKDKEGRLSYYIYFDYRVHILMTILDMYSGAWLWSLMLFI